MTPLLIFDCDGVLVDSEILSNRAGVELLNELGLSITLEDHIHRFVGKSAQDVEKVLESLLGCPLPEDYGAQKIQRTADLFDAELQAIPGIRKALEQLSGPRCVASGSHRSRIDQSLRLTGLAGFFEHIFSIEQVQKGKPAPDLFLLAAGTLGHAPEQCLVIEDSVSGVQAACAAGMRVLGFTGGSHCAPDHGQQLLEAGAQQVFQDMADLPALIEF